MDCPALCQAFLSTQTPALPGHGVMHVSLHVGWAIVLGALALRITAVPWLLRRALGGMVAAWTLMPGSMSPAYWLGLAFQAPSLTLIVLAGISLYIAARAPPRHELASEQQDMVSLADGRSAHAADVDATHLAAKTGINASTATGVLRRAIDAASIAGIVLGWLLLADTFALLPFSLYAVGFSTIAIAAVALLALLPWIVFGSREGGAWVALVGVLVVALFVTTRLPTGNLWAALLDPWLWLGLQFGWLGRALRRFNRRSARATLA